MDAITPNSSIETVIGDETAGSFIGYDHVTWYVSNAKQAASYFCSRFGFEKTAYRGLETGSKDICSHVIKKNSITMIFTCALRAKASQPENESLVEDIHQHVRIHGDAVKDVAFAVDDVAAIYAAALDGGAKPVKAPTVLSDVNGEVHVASIKAIGDGTHTFIDRSRYYSDTFMPGFSAPTQMKPTMESYMDSTGIIRIDHCVANQGWDQMEKTCEFYRAALNFHKFWSVDDKQVCTEYSALRSTVMASANDLIKMPVNEPAPGKKRSQVEEFNMFNGGPGIQHLALLTEDIIETVTAMRERGVEFISVPNTYYDILKQRLSRSRVRVAENLQVLQDLNILIDFDENGYLLQLFTKPLADRPTIFIEIIQRENFNGFGAGNFRSLFESIEQEQALRGTLD